MSAPEQDRSDDDSFEDAPEIHSPVRSTKPPVPTTRVEKTDDVPRHGEVPGTEAYEMRQSDAVPDQLEVVPEGSRSRSSSIDQSRPESASGRRASIPKTVVEKVDPASQSHGEVPGTEAHAIRQADAEPDEVLQAPESARAPLDGTPASPTFSASDIPDSDNVNKETSKTQVGEQLPQDDFDDFEEGGGDDDDDDFGEFDEGDGSTEQPVRPLPAAEPPPFQPPLAQLQGLTTPEAVAEACEPYLNDLFPISNANEDKDLSPVSNSFLNERSHSLWSQLVAPPALQPPNWVRSRTRRLFLVSLGVPVDLDEILPASKQKKLVLPSIDIEGERRTTSMDGTAATGSVARLKQKNSSSASVGRTSSKSERKRRGPPPPPDFDENKARLICSTTTEALVNLSDDELKVHKERLEDLKKRASEALEYWLIQRDSANGDKEAFEEVIQNLVKHAQKIRT